MPVENERKFVLRPPYDGLGEPCCNKEYEALSLADCMITIDQAYLPTGTKANSIRIRKSVNTEAHRDLRSVLAKYSTTSFVMTVKQQINGDCLEVETNICEDDYIRLWSVSECKLKKHRYILDGKWEIDFLKNTNGSTYFGQAEIELPEGVLAPSTIHPFVEKHLLYKVGKGDNRFTNKKLSNVNYADRMLVKLLHRKRLVK